ncbi:MAG: hypothetical protein ACE5WD_05150 [Candidatus Aminicenantia bacterium]
MISFSKKTLILLMTIVFIATGVIFAGKVIQTQESDTWDGLEIDLISLKIKNNVLTLKFKIRNNSSEALEPGISYQACYIMDETNQKKYYPLKDSDGNYIAGPVKYGWDGGYFQFKIKPGKSIGMWIKFPEPTDNPETITIHIPGFFPFEEVKLSK